MGTLYIVATPIGNMKDITYRAIEVLKSVDCIACEDTRHSLKLLNTYGISKPLKSVRSENEEAGAKTVLALLEQGQDLAYLSDAGTPGLSDPGNRLADLTRKAGFPVIPIPGASAFTALASISGYSGKSLLFEGFLSPKPGKRRNRLEELGMTGFSFVLYESPFRIIKLLKDLSDILPEREILLGREMTKMHEEYLLGTAENLLETLCKREKIQGEFSVLVYGKKKS